MTIDERSDMTDTAVVHDAPDFDRPEHLAIEGNRPLGVAHDEHGLHHGASVRLHPSARSVVRSGV